MNVKFIHRQSGNSWIAALPHVPREGDRIKFVDSPKVVFEVLWVLWVESAVDGTWSLEIHLVINAGTY